MKGASGRARRNGSARRLDESRLGNLSGWYCNGANIRVDRVEGDLEDGSEVERTSLARLALQPNPTAHQVDEPGANRETQAGAAVFSRSGAVGLTERLENHLLFLQRNTDSLVFDRKMEREAVLLRTPDTDLHGDL